MKDPMESRTKNSYQTLIYDFLKFDILVTCPKCDRKAVVRPGPLFLSTCETDQIKAICSHCGFNKKLSDTPSTSSYTKSEPKKDDRYFLIGESVDPFFQLPLWLQKECMGHLLWAYNHEHIDFLISHIQAKLRERNGQDLANKSLGSRLPRWMTSKNNREAILKELTELKNKSDSK